MDERIRIRNDNFLAEIKLDYIPRMPRKKYRMLLKLLREDPQSNQDAIRRLDGYLQGRVKAAEPEQDAAGEKTLKKQQRALEAAHRTYQIFKDTIQG